MAGFASAQEVNYTSIDGNYTNLSVSGEDANIFGLAGSIDYTNSGFVFNGGLSYTDFDGDIDVTVLSFRAGYEVSPDIIIFGGANFLDTEGFDETIYTLGAEASFGQFTAGLSFFQVDEDDADTFTAVYGSYRVSDELEVAALIETDGDDTITVLGADFDMGGTTVDATYTVDEDIYIFGVSGHYDFGNGFRAGGDYATFDGEVDFIAVSGGYEVSENMWVDLSVGRFDLDGEEVDTLGLEFTFETGGQTLLIDRAETVQARSLGVAGALLNTGLAFRR
ncbi:hypothetical protein [Pseudooctadecabacter jejudonensis]|nr:hypothetical protein [Pseudooctadecabacter jejudonensis]